MELYFYRNGAKNLQPLPVIMHRSANLLTTPKGQVNRPPFRMLEKISTLDQVNNAPMISSLNIHLHCIIIKMFY